MRRSILALLVSLCLCVPACAAPDVFRSAVAFALTGSDDAKVQVIDRANCVFGIGKAVFRLNNVEVDRILIQGWIHKDALGEEKFFTVELHGDDPIYENTTQVEEEKSDIRDVQEFYKELRQKQPDLFLPHHTVSNEHTLTLHTDEGDRLTRAWQYIYANGCNGKKSAF